MLVWALRDPALARRSSWASCVLLDARGRHDPGRGLGAWFDYIALIRQITDPVTTEHNVTPGAIACELGAVDGGRRSLVQLAGHGRRHRGAGRPSARSTTVVASFLVAVVASQLVSPVLWDHYAMLLLLPVAWLRAPGQLVGDPGPAGDLVPADRRHPADRLPDVFAIALAAIAGTWRRAH